MDHNTQCWTLAKKTLIIFKQSKIIFKLILAWKLDLKSKK